MQRRIAPIIAALVFFLVGISGAAQESVTVTGCLTAVEGGYVLRNALPAAADGGRSARTTSSKASVPIMAASSFTTTRSTAGSNTSKGSTPINPAPVASTSSGAQSSAGTNSSKASTPVVRRASNPATYELDADASQISPHAGHTVEVTGTSATPSTSAPTAGNAQKLKVISVRMVLASCSA